MKKRRNKFRLKAKRRRNAAGAGAIGAPRRRVSMPRINRAPPPDLKTLASAVAASVGSSIASGLIVNQRIAEPETTALLMTAIGGVGAYFTGGNLRVACTGIAAAGAGQYALAKLGKAALKGPAAQAPAALQVPIAAAAQGPVPPPAPPEPSRSSATGRSAVGQMFRDASADLEALVEDEWRYGANDTDPEDVVEIDLDEAA